MLCCSSQKHRKSLKEFKERKRESHVVVPRSLNTRESAQKPNTLNTLNIVPSSMSMLMSNSLGMPVSLCGGSSFFGIFSKMFSADLLSLSLFSSSTSAWVLKGRRKRRALFVKRFDLWGEKGRRFDFPFCWETTQDAHVFSIIVAFVVLLSLSLLHSVRVFCALRVICRVILLLVSPFLQQGGGLSLFFLGVWYSTDARS